MAIHATFGDAADRLKQGKGKMPRRPHRPHRLFGLFNKIPHVAVVASYAGGRLSTAQCEGRRQPRLLSARLRTLRWRNVAPTPSRAKRRRVDCCSNDTTHVVYNGSSDWPNSKGPLRCRQFMRPPRPSGGDRRHLEQRGSWSLLCSSGLRDAVDPC